MGVQIQQAERKRVGLDPDRPLRYSYCLSSWSPRSESVKYYYGRSITRRVSHSFPHFSASNTTG